MSLKRETSGAMEQRDDGNVRHPHSRSAILRRRIMGAFVLVLSVLVLTMYAYYRSTYLGSTDWLVFWGYELIIGVVFIIGVVRVLRKTPKL
jgi:hypothetical protein